MPKIYFDLIDCKDGYFILGTDDTYRRHTSKKNLEIIEEARIKYLQELLALQNRIIEEFEPQLEEVTVENVLPNKECDELIHKLYTENMERYFYERTIWYS
jgi:hypothetical protein